MSERYPFAQKGADNLRLNRECLARAEGIDAPETDHNPPSKSSHGDKIHYTATYDWDEAAANYMSATTALQNVPNAEYYADAARRGLRVLTDGIDDEGFLPNYRYIENLENLTQKCCLHLVAERRKATIRNHHFWR